MSGNFLFKYRGQIPILLFLIVIPFIYYTDYQIFSSKLLRQNMIISFLISFIGMMIRIYTVGTTPAGTSGRNREKQIAKKLNQTGLYSIVRHPLYLGNFLIWLGVSMYTVNTLFTVFLSLFFVIYYNIIMKTEEEFLEKKFQNQFLLWKKNTPMFFPSLNNYHKSNYIFSIKTVLKREYSSFLATVFSFLYVQALINLFNKQEVIISRNMWIVLIVSVSITLTLRTIKKKTSILNQKGRT